MNPELLNELQQNLTVHELYDPAQETDVQMTEQALQVKLPRSYREFVLKFSNGAYLYETQEVSAVGLGNRQIFPIRNIQTYYTNTKLKTLDETMTIEWYDGGTAEARYLLPFSLDHRGNAWCFVANNMQNEEYEVGYLDLDHLKLYGRLPDFNAWLKQLIAHKEEVIRTLYGDDVIVMKLRLG